jgi:hypothetical protein
MVPYILGLSVLLADLDAYEHTDTGTITSLARGRRMFALPRSISHYHQTISHACQALQFDV